MKRINVDRSLVIWDPEDPRAGGLIGKEVYFFDDHTCDGKRGLLECIDPSSVEPFTMHTTGEYYTFIAIIPKPKLRVYKWADRDLLRDLWIKDREMLEREEFNLREMKVIGFEEIDRCSLIVRISPEAFLPASNLMKDFVNLDGSELGVPE